MISTSTSRRPRVSTPLKASGETTASIWESVGSTANEIAIETSPWGNCTRKVALLIQVIASGAVREARFRSMMMPTFWMTMLSTTGA